MKSSSDYLVNSLTSQNTKMETSTEKQLPFRKTYQLETFSNLDLVNELNLLVTNDTSCQTDFQSDIGRPRYNDADHLISTLNKHIKSLEKQFDEKRIIIETLLQNIHNCSNNNIVANSNHKADKGSFEKLISHEKFKTISNKSNQADDDSQNNIDNHKRTSEQKMNNL